MEFGIFYLPSIGNKQEILQGMAGRRTDLYQRMLWNLAEQAQYLDAHGYYGVAFTEHHFHIEGEEVSTNPILLDMFLGMQTKTMRVGQLGLVLPCQNPLRVAEDVAILDQVTHLTRRERKRCKFASMKQHPIADLYSDYLLASFGATTATGLSELLEGEVSHDQVTRYLAGTKKTATDLWRTVKAFVRQVQSEQGVLIIDDSIEEKPYTDENDIVCWHYDHSKDRMLKGINFLTALYRSQGVSLPVGFHLVAKTEKYVDPKTQKEKRRSPVSKNTVCQEQIKQAVTNRIPFRFVLFDVWFASAETLMFIKQEQQRDFICPLKTNRKVALSVADKHQGRYTRVDTLEFEAQAAKIVYLEGVDFPLVLVKQVFTNEDGSVGIRYLVSSETTLSFKDLTTTYHERWGVECYHKSLKQNVSLAKSPTHTVTTQTNHFFAALCGFIKLERLKGKTKLNHFALKAKLYFAALHSAFATLRTLTPVRGSA